MKKSFKDKLAGLFKKSADYRSILIIGMPKTGTTALYHSIKSALPDNSSCFFEPHPETFSFPKNARGPLLVKTFFQMYDNYKDFDKKILITRDPRDQMLSEIMYYPFPAITRDFFSSKQELHEYLDNLTKLIKMKEQEPGSVTVRQLDSLSLNKRGNVYGNRLMNLYSDNPDIFLLKYEDLVEDNLDSLSNYLGFKVKNIQEVPEKRVVRTKSYNNWKNWFTPQDAEYYKDFVKPYMETFGYSDDWELNSTPYIDPKEGSEYLERIIAEARKKKQNQPKQ